MPALRVQIPQVDERAEPDGDDTAARQPDGSPDASDDEGGEDRRGPLRPAR